MHFKRVALVEIGATHVAFGVFAKAGKNRCRLAQFAWEPFSLGVGREEDWLPTLKSGLLALRQRAKYRGPVTVVLPGHVVLTKFVRTPRVDAAKREKVVRFEAQQNIPYALSDVVWDHSVLGETELECEVMLCAAKIDAVEAICGAMKDAGLTPRALVPSVQTLAAAYRFSVAQNSPATLLLNLGARSTSLVLVDADRVHVRTLAFGGHAVTQWVMESQDCDFAEAESIKVAERNASLLEPAVEAFATRLAQEITRSALHFKRHSGAANPERVLLTGGASRMPGLAKALSAKLSTHVVHFDALGGVEIAPAAAEADAPAHAAALTDMVGAALLQLRSDSSALNLLPPRLRTQETSRKRQPWLVAASVLFAAALLLPLHHFRELGAELKTKIAALEAEIAPLRVRDSRNRANLERLAELQRQIGVLQSTADRRENWLALLTDLQARLVEVEDVWLERMQLAASSGESPAPLRIAVSGRILDKANALANVSPDIYRRVTTLLGSIVESPYVSAVENERFDNRRPGILHFDFVLVGEPTRPL